MKEDYAYKEVVTCYTCPHKVPYVVHYSVRHSCRHIEDSDTDVDCVCGKHPKILNTKIEYNLVSACNNCYFLKKTREKDHYATTYECMFDAVTIHDGKTVEPHYVCDMHDKSTLSNWSWDQVRGEHE